MGGRGSSSASSGASSTGSSSADRVVSAALAKYKDIQADSRLKETTAKRVLSDSGGTPLKDFHAYAKTLVENNSRNEREVANFQKELSRREKQIEKEESLMRSYSKETRQTTSIRGETITTNSKRYEEQARKVSLLNKALTQYYREYGAKKRAVKEFNEKFAEKIDKKARTAMLAENYRRKNR